jgi:hypothetical protein
MPSRYDTEEDAARPPNVTSPAEPLTVIIGEVVLEPNEVVI